MDLTDQLWQPAPIYYFNPTARETSGPFAETTHDGSSLGAFQIPATQGPLPMTCSSNPLASHRILRLSVVALSLAAAIFSTSTAVAVQKRQAFLDPQNAGPDYAHQGEYKGTLSEDDASVVYGVQVIALGESKFRVVGFKGGLPGEGWKRGDVVRRGEGKLENGKVTAEVEGATVEIANGKLTVTVDGKSLGTLRKVERKSPTLGKQPPAGAEVLFDGSSADAFDNGKLYEGKWLQATGCSSKAKFQDHHLHVEFRTPFVPAARGQGRGNSGVYIQSRFECQVLDSFGLEGKNNECGGIYSIAEPVVNMCFPPLTWQTYDIDFTAAKYDDSGKKIKNARVTIAHNGIVIHDDVELPKATPGRHGEGAEPDSLYLQDHGNPVVFRNIWVLTKDD